MDGFDRRQKQLSVERKERIRYVLANKNRLTRVELAEHWGIKVQGVSDFLRKHGLPKLPKGVPGENSRRSAADQVRKERIDYVLKNHKRLSLEELSERWGIKPYTRLWPSIRN